jgi:hypothetical protein
MEFVAGAAEELGLQEPVNLSVLSVVEWREALPDEDAWATDDSTMGAWDKATWDTEQAHLVFIRKGLPEHALINTIAHELKHCQQGERLRAGEDFEMPTIFDQIMGTRPYVEVEADEFAWEYTGFMLTDMDFDDTEKLP